jgi:hypothetical protein
MCLPPAGSQAYNSTFFCDYNTSSTYYGGEGACYLFGGGSGKTWYDAREVCQQKGGDLVVFETYEEQSFVSAHS